MQPILTPEKVLFYVCYSDIPIQQTYLLYLVFPLIQLQLGQMFAQRWIVENGKLACVHASNEQTSVLLQELSRGVRPCAQQPPFPFPCYLCWL